MRELSLILLVSVLTAVSYAQTAFVTGENAYLRGSPVETGAVVDTLLPDTKVEIIRQRGPWFLVQASPFVGWMHGNFLSFKRPADPVLTSPVAAAQNAPSQPPSGIQPSESSDPKAKTGVAAPGAASVTPVTAAQPATSDKRVYTRGPRGGCYYIRSDGKKIYGDHKECG